MEILSEEMVPSAVHFRPYDPFSSPKIVISS
jgi:hypothetical protein